MKKRFHPKYIIPAVPMSKGKSLRFIMPDGRGFDITEHVDLVWKILEYCTGYFSIEDVIRRVGEVDDKNDSDLVATLLRQLISIGVVVDSRAAYGSFHPYTNNPAYFSHELTQEDVLEYTRSPRLTAKKGSLTKVAQRQTQLASIQSKRRSCRSFTTSSVGKELLGHILVSGYSLQLHTSPSAGGLYPLKIFVIVTRANRTLEQGYYEYDPSAHELIRYAEFDQEEINYIFGSDPLLYGAPVVVTIAGDLARHTGKYANRGYRFTLLEAGHVAQNIHLAAAESGLGSLEYGGFADKPLAHELKLQEDSPQLQPLITIALGYRSSGVRFNVDAALETLKKELVGRGKPLKDIALMINQKSTNHNFLAYAARATGRYAGDAKKHFSTSGTAASSSMAQLKAIAEGYERYASGIVRFDLEATAAKLTKEKKQWLDPRDVSPFTDQQYSVLTNLEKFNEQKVWQWVLGKRASTGEKIYIPIDLVYYPFWGKPWGRKPCVPANSSGVAAYTNEPEAIKRGVLELVERHAIMKSWLTREVPKHIPVELLPYHWRRRATYWKERGYTTHVLDMSVHGVVVINVVISAESYPCFTSGAAASIDSFEQALAKAFTETELMLTTTLAHNHNSKNTMKAEEVEEVSDHGDFFAHPDTAKKIAWLLSGPASKKLPTPTIKLDRLLTSLDAVVVRLSPKDAPLTVVRILSKHLIPIQFGYGTNHYSHQSLDREADPVNAWLPHYFA